MALIKCPECGKEISDKAENCPNCGFPVAKHIADSDNNALLDENSMKPCPKCGFANNLDKTYCDNCGNPLLQNNVDNYREKSQDSFSRFGDVVKTFIITLIAVIVFLGLLVTISMKKSENASTKKESHIPVENVTNKSQEESTSEYASETAIQNEEEPQSISKEDFVASCQEIPYKTLARNPDDYVGEHIVLTVKVAQIIQGGMFDSNQYYRVYTNDEYNLWLGDEYFMHDSRSDDDTKILQDDILTVYAEFDGVETIERALTGAKEDVLSIKAVYIELIEDYEQNGYSEITDAATTTADKQESVDDGLTTGQKNALSSAKNYLSFQPFSYQGLIEQLEYEQYSHDDAVFAADNCGADWNEQALKSAKSYLDFSAFSYNGLIKQLEYEKFTTEQATYGADNCGADWNEQASKSAKSYLDLSSFSRDELIKQLEYEGFTSEQATYGVESNGY